MINNFEDILKLLAESETVKADTELERMLTFEKDEKIIEKIKSFRTFIANKILKESGFRSDVLYYLVGALNYYKGKSKQEIQKVAFEIGQKGADGLNINDNESQIEIKALGKKLSHLQAICYMYAGFKLFEPKLDIGIDLKDEFEQAKILG
ncbi:MAG TPA: hypothetical protein PK771_00245 [Spirochaetota bacterium]|nr:hypothetical protein [Spirochaetota bacterium]